MPVHVIESRRARPDHLETRQFRAPVDILIGQFRFKGPDMLLQPCLERDVVRIPPEERHGGVGVRVHKAGHERFVAGIDDHICLISGTSDLRDGSAVDIDIAIVLSVF